jgi:hypothetical protein
MTLTIGRAGWTAAAVFAAALGTAMWASDRPEGAAQTPPGGPAASAGAHANPVQRGEYIVNAFGCTDCHTPHLIGEDGRPEPDPSRFLSGHPGDQILPPPPPPSGPWIGAVAAPLTGFAGPWGVSLGRNLTPDKETGLGAWTEEQFVQTIRTGRQQGRGREILPPMPWPVLKNMTDDDLKAIFAYLQTIPAIKNKVPEPVFAEQ